MGLTGHSRPEARGETGWYHTPWGASPHDFPASSCRPARQVPAGSSSHVGLLLAHPELWSCCHSWGARARHPHMQTLGGSRNVPSSALLAVHAASRPGVGPFCAGARALCRQGSGLWSAVWAPQGVEPMLRAALPAIWLQGQLSLSLSQPGPPGARVCPHAPRLTGRRALGWAGKGRRQPWWDPWAARALGESGGCRCPRVHL